MIRIARRVALAIAVSSLSPDAVWAAMQTPSPASFKILVIAGEDAVNVVQQKTATAPVIEVRDSNNQPIAGVIVRFTIRNGRNARFASGARSVSLTTNVAGRAATTGLTPTGTGLVQIDVAATLQGQSAAATIVQTNFATAAQAAAGGGSTAASGASGGSGGGLSTTTLAVVGGAAAGGAIAATQVLGGGGGPTVCGTGFDTQSGFDTLIADANLINFQSLACDENEVPIDATATFFWDFKDGTTATQANVSHTFRVAGTFSPTITVNDGARSSDAREVGTFTIFTLTGRWRVGSTSTFYDLVQNGTTVAGTSTNGVTQGSIVGALRTSSPNVTLTITQGGVVSTFTGGPAFSLPGGSARTDALDGFLTGSGNVTLTKQ